MAAQKVREIVCPECGNSVFATLWTGIRAGEDSELREKILQENFFNWECPECGYASELLYPCLYSDRERNFVLFHCPQESGFRSEELPELSGTRRRLVSSPLELREKILIFESGLDDRAIELVKYAIGELLLQKTGARVRQGYYTEMDQQENRIGFTFFVEGAERPLQRTVQLAVYEKIREVARLFGPPETGFFRMDSEAAKEIMEKYKRG